MCKVRRAMIPWHTSALLAIASLSDRGAAGRGLKGDDDSSSWLKFGSNTNYRMTAVLDVNGGANRGPDFASTLVTAEGDTASGSGSSSSSAKTPGYGVPLDVITLVDPSTGTWRQRVSYHGGTQVDYNVNGAGYKVVPTPYGFEIGDDGDGSSGDGDGRDGATAARRTCFSTGGGSEGGDARDDDDEEKVGYLNFFPTEEQMGHYTAGRLVTSDPGVPCRIASLESPHGSYNATPSSTNPDASYGLHPGMPSEDWFQFHYEEDLSGGRGGGRTAFRPLKWTMLARNQIINAHTENWVLRYLSYESIEDDDERKIWENWFDATFANDCGGGEGLIAELAVAGRGAKLNRLGMFFSSRAHEERADPSHSPEELSRFDAFLALHNRDYPRGGAEYSRRKAIHDANVRNLERWNSRHAGVASFGANEFMDMDAKEVMAIRGGHVPRSGRTGEGEGGEGGERAGNLRRSAPDVRLGNGSDEDRDEDKRAFTQYHVPKDFDPSTLPESFDWREHLPGSVGPVKDQGFCGSCWAFSLVSAIESHWFIATGQSVTLPEQFVNDCAWSKEGSRACDGGDAGYAAKDLIARFDGRVPVREDYGGYLSVDGGCYVDVLRDMGVISSGDGDLPSVTTTPQATARITDWVVLPPRNDAATKHALYTKGPLSVAVNVVDKALYYANGVLDDASCEENDAKHLDHAVSLVGWGVDLLPDGTKAEHWILRNSWSDLWGDKGYFKVRMGKRDCGVTTGPGFPVMAGTASHSLRESSNASSMS